MRNSEIVIVVLVIISFVIGIYLYPAMPERMASHWNMEGNVDGYFPKFWGLFLLPFIVLGLAVLFIAIPYIDPLRSNLEKFRKYFDGLVILIILYLIYMYLLTIFWSMGFTFNIIRFITPAFGVLFIYIGFMFEKSKRNWFVGIRTPWTMTNRKVWENTHKRGGALFKLAGVIAFLGIFFPFYGVYIVLASVILAVAYLFTYSYFEYRRIIRRKQRK